VISHLNDLSRAHRAGRSSRVAISPCGLPEGRRREGWGGRRAVSGIVSLDMPFPVHEMTPAKNRIGAGSRAGLSGAITCTAPASGRGRSAKRGRGGEIGGRCMGSPSRLRPTRAITTKSPAPGRGPGGRTSMVFVDGEGVPSPTPPRMISPQSGAWDDAGEGWDRGRLLGRPFRRYHLHCPRLGRGRSAKCGRGGGERRAVHGFALPITPYSGYHHDIPRSCAGTLGKGQYGFCRRGGGSLPDPSPGDIPTVRCTG